MLTDTTETKAPTDDLLLPLVRVVVVRGDVRGDRVGDVALGVQIGFGLAVLVATLLHLVGIV